MSRYNHKVTGIRVLNIASESSAAIESMVNKVIQEVQEQNIPIIDIQVTDTNCIIILGEIKSDGTIRRE